MDYEGKKKLVAKLSHDELVEVTTFLVEVLSSSVMLSLLFAKVGGILLEEKPELEPGFDVSQKIREFCEREIVERN